MELQNKEKNSIPPPPAADIEIRTMAGDINQIKTGGEFAVNQSSVKISEPLESSQSKISVSGTEENQNKSSFFVLAVVVGVLVLAVIIGFGAYYLASKLF